MKALILAGGYGTRLGALGEKLPKPLLPLSDRKKVLDHILEGLREFFDEEDMILVTNQKFVETFRKWAETEGFKGKIIVEPHRSDEEKFGTVKGMRWAIEAADIDDDLLVMASDNIIYPFRDFLRNMLSLFDGKSAVVGAYEAGVEKIRRRFGNIEIAEGYRITRFVEKPEEPISPYAAMAIYLFPKKLGNRQFLRVLDEYLSDGNPDAPGNFIAYLAESGFPLLGNVFAGKWWDVGKIEDWRSAMEFFKQLDYLSSERVVDISLPARGFGELMRSYRKSGGFVAKKLGVAYEIMKDMLNDRDAVRFLSFPACIVSTGTRGVLKEMVKRKMFDVIITTCGTLDHDIARLFKDYYHGSFLLDDNELREKGIHRLGNVLVPQESYGMILEDSLQPIFEDIGEGEFGTHELIWEVGKRLDAENREDSIIYWAWKNRIPVVVPGPYDGAFGYQLWLYQQDHDLKLNLWKDEKLLDNMVADARKTGALMIGGGISKHHVIWWNQFREGLDYAVYITTAVEWDGSLSGARMREAVSWNKVKERARYVTVEGDATVLLPLLAASLL